MMGDNPMKFREEFDHKTVVLFVGVVEKLCGELFSTEGIFAAPQGFEPR